MISCNQHDYIEIVCMYNYPVELKLKTGDSVNGVAEDTQLNESREECIKIQAVDGERLVPLDSLDRLDVLVENPHFQTVIFSQSD
jgi:Rho-binding antiterminator